MSKFDTMLEEAYRQRLTTQILEDLAGLAAPDVPAINVPDGKTGSTDIETDIPEATNKAVEDQSKTCTVVDISDKVLEGLQESADIDTILDILEENGYELTMDNVEALVEGLRNGSIGIFEDNLDLSKDEMDKTVSNADVGIMPRDTHDTENDLGVALKKPVAVYDIGDTDDDLDVNIVDVIGEIAPEINTTGVDAPAAGDINVDIEVDDPLKESFDAIFAALSDMKLSEACCGEKKCNDIDAEVVSGGGLATGDSALVKGTEAGEKDCCGNLVVGTGKDYIPHKAKEDKKPSTIKEALMLTPEYFQESSFKVVTPEMKEDRLKVQLALRIAKEKMDPMFDELRKAATEAKKLQDALVEKYSSEAAEKSDKITGKDDKKDEE